MGCGIHGVWECMLPNGTWVAFREINVGQNYTWFGIMSGVRGWGPKVESISFRPEEGDDDPEVVGRFWYEFCQRDVGLHSHTLASFGQVRLANEIFSEEMAENWGEEAAVEADEHEPLPTPGEIVEMLWFGFDGQTARPTGVPMMIPLREVLGLPEGVHQEDDRFTSRVRYLCAYDS